MAQTTKAKGDIAEYRVVAELLERGHSVLMPCGDRLPYDIGVDVGGRLVRLQVRRAWPSDYGHCVDVRRSQTNRKVYKHTKHGPDDYDYLVAWIPNSGVTYIIPSTVSSSYGSNITFNEKPVRQKKMLPYKEAWHLIDAEKLS